MGNHLFVLFEEWLDTTSPSDGRLVMMSQDLRFGWSATQMSVPLVGSVGLPPSHQRISHQGRGQLLISWEPVSDFQASVVMIDRVERFLSPWVVSLTVIP